ncbi:MAG: glutamate-cysteine ligase family protein [Gemmatimonadota bacterium]
MKYAASARSAWVERYLAEHCFSPPASSRLTFGAELELLAYTSPSHTIAPIVGQHGQTGTLDIVRIAAKSMRWAECVSAKGVPRFASASGGSLTFEPGGQLEYASAVHHSLDALAHELTTVESLLTRVAQEHGIELVARGVDPYNGASDAPLQLTAERYARMARHFATIGADGARMMRQTASLQVNIGGIRPTERWAVANAMAPMLVAMFANSAQYAGTDTGCASYRAETWRGVDPCRTGVFDSGDPVREYAAFALRASAILAADESVPFHALPDGVATDAALATHLTTLFPEVRPRQYLELRSIDAVDGARRAIALGLVAGVLCDGAAAQDAVDLLGRPDEDVLRAAGIAGLADEPWASRARDLIDIAARGCMRLGGDIVSPALVEEMRAAFGAVAGLASPTARS